MEHCAAQLEAMRSHFLALGGSNRNIVGAYQANFLFLGDEGVFTGTSLRGRRAFRSWSAAATSWCRWVRPQSPTACRPKLWTKNKQRNKCLRRPLDSN